VKPFQFVVIILVPLLLAPSVWGAQPSEQRYESAEAFLEGFDFKSGSVDLPNGVARLDVPDTFRYIGPEDSRRFLEEGWGNPDGSGQIGMLLPTDTDLFASSGWAVVISYEEDGYVSDKDANLIDYDELLKSMQASTRKGNETRTQKGYEPVTLVGWAASPYYDSNAKKLYWAKELQFGEAPEHTLNYNVRILGRKGVLVLNAVADMGQLPLVEDRMEQVIGFTNFKEGHRYSDFDPGVDKVAAYGLAALIGGKVAAKVGLLAKLGGVLVAFKKFIIIGFLAIAGFFSKIFKRRKAGPVA
jgi:uncharacterized membrane-anchored protein